MFVPNFEAIGHVTSVLGSVNLSKSLTLKAVSFKKRQKIFNMVISFKIPFHPCQVANPFSAAMRFFLFCFFLIVSFFFPNLVYSSPKPQNIKM